MGISARADTQWGKDHALNAGVPFESGELRHTGITTIGQDQEAVVPIVNQFSGHFVLLYDNTSTFVTGIAIANPTPNIVSIPVTIRNELGQVIDQQFIALGPYAHEAFVLPTRWPSTVGNRGAIEFLASAFGVGALGLRFNGNAFTSFEVLENLNWLPSQ